MPDELRPAEPALRELITGAIRRGKIECRVGLRPAAAEPAPTGVDPTALARLAALESAVRAALPGAAPLSVAEVLRWPGVLGDQTNGSASPETLAPEIQAAGREALAAFEASRVREGQRLAELILERAAAIEAIAGRVAERAPELLAEHEKRLVDRLRQALDSLAASGNGETIANIPQEETLARIRQEVTLHGMRIDVDEEIGRLRAHVAELREALAGPGPVGKRLDFLMQEFNREANTIGSKAAALEMTQAAVELKLLVEQVREQVQNLE